jgi:hypothetical protein
LCNGNYPWEGERLPGGGGVAPLITRLRQHRHELARAKEELKFLAIDRALCARFYTERLAKVKAALADAEAAEAAAALAAAATPGARAEVAFQAGRVVILKRHLVKAEQQLDLAQRAFAMEDWDAAADMSVPDAGDSDEDGAD